MKKSMLLFITAMCLGGYVNAQYNMPNQNTIVYNSPKGIRYRLISIGDKLPQLLVNDKEVPRGQMEGNEGIIEKLQTELWERQKKLGNRENEMQLNSIVSDLVLQKIINSANALISFRLDKSGFVVNGQKQTYAVFARYRDKFITSSEMVYQFNND
jgi:hypothetical protein